MKSYSLLLILFFVLLIIEMVYFKMASRFNIVDRPNHRSSHDEITIRGGGIIFVIGIMLYPFFFGLDYVYFIIGLMAIGAISFVDDIQSVSRIVRLLFHTVAVSLLFYQLGIFSLSVYLVFLCFIVVIGSVNAINFMDGINGITGVYSLVVLSSLFYVNAEIQVFANSSLLLTAILSVVVFLIFNLRKKAICFAGDVGSVGIAFIMLFFILQAVIELKDLKYLFFLSVYGADSTTTIIFRLIRGENITLPHRNHFYQFLANEKGISHVMIALYYGIVQLVLNYTLINMDGNDSAYSIILIGVFVLLFILIRFIMEGFSKLLGR